MPKNKKKKKLLLQNILELKSRIDKLEEKQLSNSITGKNKDWKFWIPTLVSFLAICLSFFSILNDRDIASKSGEFNKGSFELYLGNFKLDSNKKSIIIIINEIENAGVLLLETPFAIYNSGTAKIENCNITISYPKINGKIAVDTEKYFIPKNIPINISRRFYEEDLFDLIRYDIHKMQPTELIRFNELSVFRNSSISTSVEVFDKDSIPLTVGYKAEIAYNSILDIKSDKLTSINYKIDYHHFKIDNWKEIKKSHFINEYIKNKDVDVYVLKDAISEQKTIKKTGNLTISTFQSDKILKIK